MKKERYEKELKKLKKYYEDELKRRDRQIDELREQNKMIMAAALKQSKKINELTERLKKYKK